MSIEKPHFDRLVGIKDILNIPDDAAREEAEKAISDTLENEGGKFIDGLELEKTGKDKEMIELAGQKVDEYMRQYGRENIPEIPLNNIHLLKEGGTEKHTKGNLSRGGANSALNSVIIDRDASDLHLAQTLFHELYHQKSYKALQVTKTEEPKFVSYHTGFKMVSRDGEEVYFKDLEEALTSIAEQRFFTEVLMNDERFRAEIEGMSEEEKARLFTRNSEQEKLNSLVDKLFEANKNEFGSRDEILKMFFEAQATGRLLKVARLIEKTFGKGSFRKVGENVLKDNKPGNFLEQEKAKSKIYKLITSGLKRQLLISSKTLPEKKEWLLELGIAMAFNNLEECKEEREELFINLKNMKFENEDDLVHAIAEGLSVIVANHFSLPELEQRLRTAQIEEQAGYREINRALLYEIKGDKVRLHIPIVFTEKPSEFKELFKEGLRKLAEQMCHDNAFKDVRTISGESTIIYYQRRLVKSFGFAVTLDETARFGTAEISREDLLDRYSNKNG